MQSEPNHAFIYIRGEVTHVVRRVQQAIEDAYKAGLLGKNILGKGFDLELVLHVGAGAYICGEETALLDSLEGFEDNQDCVHHFQRLLAYMQNQLWLTMLNLLHQFQQ